MNAFLLLIPFLFIRFILLSSLNSEALRRASYFAPVKGKEKPAYYIYQILNISMFIYTFLIDIEPTPHWQFYLGIIFYIVGLLLCTITIINFANPNDIGFNKEGIYKYSRNPMYLSYFIFFVGVSLLTKSYILLTMTLLFQISSHWIILSEERWCLEKFDSDYKSYMEKVRRYL